MPDPKRESVSSTEAAALYNQSPFITRWMLYHKLRNGADVETEPDENERMTWGKRLQDDILDETAARLHLDVTPNAEDVYLRRPYIPIGATRDASIFSPDWGPGVVEAKNVDWLQWRDKWTPDLAPAHIELQTQVAMMVGDGRRSASWGVIACLVGGNELRLYKRSPMLDLWRQLARDARDFMRAVANGNEPDPFGAAGEIPIINQLYPETTEDEPLHLDDVELAEEARMYRWAHEQSSSYKRTADRCKAQILGRVKDHGLTYLPETMVKVSKSHQEGKIVELPDTVRRRLTELLDRDDLTSEQADAIRQAVDFEYQVRKPSVRTTVTVKNLEPAERDEAPEVTEIGA
jgi:hypothetical protein